MEVLLFNMTAYQDRILQLLITFQSFLNLRISAMTGITPTPSCAVQGLTNEITFPRTSSCIVGLGIGSKRTVRLASANRGVQISAVLAIHPDELGPGILSDSVRTILAPDNLSAYGGLSMGYVVSFTNGLTVYLSGDTGLTGDMKTIVNAFYQPNLVVFNIGDISETGPEEAAFAITDLIRPTAVIASHANEVATSGGVVQPGTRTARFIELVSPGLSVLEPLDLIRGRKKVSVFVPLSGITMEFDGNARCLTGCQGLQPR